MGSNQYLHAYPPSDTNAAPKKKAPRKNPWGNSSYADLITQAIETSPEKKLTLSQIYDWMIRNVPHFSNQGSSNSSAGWKNSIRHNLSLHERFFRLKGEETSGKSSWWTVNRDAGTGKTTRRKSGGKKRAKNHSLSQKSFLKKLSESNSSTKYFPLPNVNGSLRSMPNFPSSSQRQSVTRSSTSSEDNESVQSIESGSSPSCNENEMAHRETFQGSHSLSKEFFELQSVHTFSGEYISPPGNSTFSLNQNTYSYKELNSNGLHAYYPSFNKLYSQYNNQQNLSYEYNVKSTSVDDTAFSMVSTEYFKSPHHLSGSYMTSEISRVDNIYNTIPNLEKPDTFLIADLNSPLVHQSPTPIESYDSNQNNVITSNESQNLIKAPLVSEYSIQTHNTVPLNDMNQPCSKNEVDNFSEKVVHTEIKKNNEKLQNHLQFYCRDPYEIKLEVHEEDSVDFSTLTELRLKQSKLEFDSILDQNYFSTDTVDDLLLGKKPDYITEQESLVNTDSIQVQNRIRRNNHTNKSIGIQSDLMEYQRQFSQQPAENCIAYNPQYLYCNNDFKHENLPKSQKCDNLPNEETVSSSLPSATEIELQSTPNSSENMLDSPLDFQDSPDSCSSPNTIQESKGMDRRKNGKKSVCSTENSKRPKLECISEKSDSDDEIVTTTVSSENNHRARNSEWEATAYHNIESEFLPKTEM